MAADVGTRFEDEKNFFGSLLRQATRIFKLETISGDKNYPSMATVRIAEELECVPYLYPKKSFKIKPGERYRAWSGNIKRCRGGTERDKEIVRLRKRIETAFSMLKQRFVMPENADLVLAWLQHWEGEPPTHYELHHKCGNGLTVQEVREALGWLS